MKRWMILAIGLLVAGCSGETGERKPGDAELTKAEARSMDGKADDGEDLCEAFGWYGDGICDDFCVDDDEDCDDRNNEDNNDPGNNDPGNNLNNTTNNSTNNATNNSTNNATNNMSGGDCGGFAGLTCADDEFCDYEDGDFCGAADALGQCSPRPDVCTDEYDPVCGCDGMTYSNACEAHAAGTDAAASGECASACAADADCAAGEVCLNGVCTADPGNNQACGGIAGIQCPAGQFCDYDPMAMCGAADQQGVCEEIPQACPDVYLPVCGCDGKTYSNSCDANAAGVSVAEDGECELACMANADCAPDQLCINGVCQDVAMGQCGGFAGFVCAADEWCDYPDSSMCGAADQLGACKPRPDACIQVFDPVCGCDGQTHSNACMAHAAGVDVAQDGACP